MTKKNYTVNDINNLKEMLCEVVYDHGERVAFLQRSEDGYTPVTYRDFMGDVFALGTALSDMGLSDTNIMILGKNSYEWALSYMSVVCGLGVAVPVDRDLDGCEIAEITRRANVSAIIYSDELENKLDELPASIIRIPHGTLGQLIDRGNEIILGGNTSYIEALVDENALCSLLFTSGTTGIAKGVMLSHKNICFSICEFRRMVRMTENDVLLSLLPMHHVYECTFGFLAPLSCGATVAFGGGLSHFTRDMKQIRPTKLFAVPVLLEAIYNKLWAKLRESGFDSNVISAVNFNRVTRKFGLDLSKPLFSEIRSLFGGRLGLVIVGGGPIAPDILMGLREVGVKAVRLYGLTECSGLVTVNRDRYFRDSSEGLSTPSGIVDVYNVTEDGIGEIRYKGAGVMLGYYNDPERTAANIRGGWLYTGDLGYFDDDGFLHVIGRRENVITVEGGKKVYPEAIETLLSKNPFIKESAVVGIARENEVDIVAVIVPDRESFAAAYGKDFTDYQLAFELEHAIDTVNRDLRKYKQIDMYVLSDKPFAKTASKKIIRQGIISSIIDKYNETK